MLGEFAKGVVAALDELLVSDAMMGEVVEATLKPWMKHKSNSRCILRRGSCSTTLSEFELLQILAWVAIELGSSCI